MVKSWLSVPAPPFPLCPASHVLDISAFDVTELSKQRHAVATDFWSESLLTYLISIKGTSAALSGWLCPRWLCIWSVNFRETDLTSVSMIVKCQWCIENFCGVWNQRVPETFKFPDPSPLGKQSRASVASRLHGSLSHMDFGATDISVCIVAPKRHGCVIQGGTQPFRQFPN